MSASINYPPLTDPDTLWASMADAADFFNAFTVPDATTASEGAVKKAAATSLPVPSSVLTEDYYSITSMAGNGSTQVDAIVVTQAAYQDLVAKYAALVDHLNQLETLLKTAGILTA
jgi:hypothetical protein